VINRNSLFVVATATFAVAYSMPAITSWADSVSEVAIQSRHLAETGKWNEARTVLENQLSQTKDLTEIARLKAELARCSVTSNTYFRKEDSLVRSLIEDARSAVQAADSKPALATLETAEGQLTYWNALEGTNDWGPPTGHFDRALQLYRELGDDLGLGEAMFYRGLVYQMQNQNQPARKCFDQALQLTKTTGDERMQSFVVRHIGYLEEAAGETDAARANYRESLELRQKNDMKVFVPFAMILLADFEGEQKHLAEAIRFAEQAIQLAESGNSTRALYSAKLTLAKLYLENGQATAAKELGEQSSAGAEAFGSVGDAKEAQNFLEKLR
jgi:tetratricopeptide (TPR) repeat protein